MSGLRMVPSNRVFNKLIVIAMSMALPAGVVMGVLQDTFLLGVLSGNILGFLIGVILYYGLKIKSATENKHDENINKS
ncbi:MAG: hypothetical protein JJU37_03395 [Balneolaceae bacterium]|nr:hypothetical protein [Balneolaceae bacterium]